MTATIVPKKSSNAKGVLRYIALFLGEVRDGLTMINMQSAFLIVSKNYTEKQAGIMFFVFGMSQFLAQTPAGYLMDYSDKKIIWLGSAAVATTLLTLCTAAFAKENGENLALMVLIKFIQGAVTAMIPPGLNSITQGIVGAVGMTGQVSMNEMMNHLGTAIIVLTGSVLAFWLYPSIGMLFIVSPIACAGVLFFLAMIRPSDIDHDAARGLTLESDTAKKNSSAAPTSPSSSYSPPGEGGTAAPTTPANRKSYETKPSFNFGFGGESTDVDDGQPHADTPLHIIKDPILLTFLVLCFLFHLSNGTVLPLVMQTLAIGEGRTGILFSGFCIIVAQLFMVASAKICGDYSVKYGRKVLFLIGLFTVPVRCAILAGLTTLKNSFEAAGNETPLWLQMIILSTQILDGVGAGVFGTMYILVTSDISGGTGRFSMTLGMTTAAMSIGGTVSGYLGQAIAQDMGYRSAFIILGVMSAVPALLYLFFMPETLPAHVKENATKETALKTMASIAEHDHEDEENSSKPYVHLT
mmetsp:Transcript_12406/g.26807  ORF Transcript_12406/g.26807 Transcript_12406/m.26807 type:complete len:524 (-) Transcript_12406:194-1765(-)